MIRDLSRLLAFLLLAPIFYAHDLLTRWRYKR